jgi:hypothetical protein
MRDPSRPGPGRPPRPGNGRPRWPACRTLLIPVLNGTSRFWNRVAGDIHAVHDVWRRNNPDAVFLAHDEEDAGTLTDQGIPHLVFDIAEQLMAAVLDSHDRLLSPTGSVPGAPSTMRWTRSPTGSICGR